LKKESRKAKVKARARQRGTHGLQEEESVCLGAEGLLLSCSVCIAVAEGEERVCTPRGFDQTEERVEEEEEEAAP
jgi:hypothetical protein